MIDARLVIAVEIHDDGRMQVREQHERVLAERTVIDRRKLSQPEAPALAAGVVRLAAGQLVADLLRTPQLPLVPERAQGRVH